MPTAKTDNQWMQLALEQASLGIGFTHPNPRVGAVIVRDDQLLGKGYHHRYGLDHAEVDALKDAKISVEGSTLYVTLEPCAAEGKTPACTSAIIASGITRVVFATSDPNPDMSGGADMLRHAGVAVTAGICKEEAEMLNRPFLHFMRTDMPWVIAKAAISLDGKLATRSHDSQWISGAESRQHAHAVRAECDAIVIGAGTLLHDNPSLTVRDANVLGNHPLRVVMSNQAPQPFAGCKLLSEDAKTRMYVTQTSDVDKMWVELGVELVFCPDLKACFQHLAASGCLQVLLEGGGNLHAACLEQGISNELLLYQAPLLIGGVDAINLWHGLGVESMSDVIRLSHVQRLPIGGDMMIRGDIVYKT